MRLGEFFEEIENYNPAHEDDSDEPETIIQRAPVAVSAPGTAPLTTVRIRQ